MKFIYKLSGEFSGRVWTTRLSAAVFFLSVLLHKRPNNNCEGTQEMHIIDGTVGECWTEDERVPELQTQSKITRKFQLKLESNKKSCFQPLALTPFAVNYKGGVGIIDVPLPQCVGE